MSIPATLRQVTYRHVVLQGSAYAAGEQWAGLIKDNPGLQHFMTSPFMGHPALARPEIERAMAFYERWCPGLNEEIAGFAHALGAAPEKVVYYYAYIQPAGRACSQFAITPAASADGRSYLGRNYDFGYDDQPFLVTRRPGADGASPLTPKTIQPAPPYATIGFALQLFGRAEGMNEHGLCVSSSAGVIMANTQEEGIKFVAVIRAVLETCQDVPEAIDLIHRMPISDCRNFMLADRRGQVALVEVASQNKAVRRAGGPGEPLFLVSANHFAMPEMAAFDTLRLGHSVTRSQAMQTRLAAGLPVLNQADLKKLLATPYPEGVCCHYYSQGMGTLWSALFDPMQTQAKICFGSPHANPWHTFNLDDATGMVQPYLADLPDEPAPSGFW